MITIKQLEALDALARCGSLARAAERLYTTESAISKRLLEMESSLGVALFDRQSRALKLSEKGHEVLRLGVEILERRDAIEELASSPEFVGRRFRFGMTELIAKSWLPALVEGIRSQYAHVMLEPRVGLTFDLIKDLRAGELDLVIVPTPVLLDGLAAMTLFESINLWVCSPNFDYGEVPITPARLTTLSLILQPSSSVLNGIVQRWFVEHHAALPTLISCNSLEGLKALAVAGFGVANLPETFCREDIAEGRLMSLDIRPALPVNTYSAIYRPQAGSILAPRMAAVIKTMLAPPPQ